MTVRTPRFDVHLWTHKDGPRRMAGVHSTFDVSKTLTSPAGTWNVQLPKDRFSGLDPLEDISDDDWLALEASDLGGAHKPTPLMFGPVGGVREHKNTGDKGETYADVTLTGADFAGKFVASQVLFNQYMQHAAETIPGLISLERHEALMNLIPTGHQASPWEVAYELYQILCDTDAGWIHLPAGVGARSLSELVMMRGNLAPLQVPGQITKTDTYVPEGATGIDALVAGIFRQPFTELFYDLRARGDLDQGLDFSNNGRGHHFQRWGMWPMIVFRRAPYSVVGGRQDAGKGWDSLPVHYVYESDVVTSELGKAGSERFTLFSVRTAHWRADSGAGTWGQSGGNIPVFTKQVVNGETIADRVARHGIRILEVTDTHAPVAGTGKDRRTPIEWIVDRSDELYAMQSRVPDQLQGTITIGHVRPEIRIGERVRLEPAGAGTGDRGTELYVIGVNHRGSTDDMARISGQTTLTVARGERYDITVTGGVKQRTSRAVHPPGGWTRRRTK